MDVNSVELKAVSVFYLVQADKAETSSDAVVDEKAFTDYKEAFRMMERSQSPIKYVRFIYATDEYKMYPIEDSEEYQVVKKPIFN